MIRDEAELVALLSRLREEYRQGVGFFATRRLPEYEILDTLELTRRERALFLTLSVVPVHDHPSGERKPHLGRSGIWDVCGTIRRQHPWVFDPEALVERRGEADLKDFFGRLEIMDDYDAHWWYTTAETLHASLAGDPIALLAEPGFVAPHVARYVRRFDLPGVVDDVCTPLWIRLMHDRVHELSGMRWMSFPVERTIFDVTVALGDLELSAGDRDDRALVAAFWRTLCRKYGLSPSSVERPLRVVGLHWDRDGETHVLSVLEDVRNKR